MKTGIAILIFFLPIFQTRNEKDETKVLERKIENLNRGIMELTELIRNEDL